MAGYGIAYGAQIANLMAVSHDMCGVEMMVVLFACEVCFEGIGSLIGAPICSECCLEVVSPSLHGSCNSGVAILVLKHNNVLLCACCKMTK